MFYPLRFATHFINENNDFGSDVMDVYEAVAKEADNVVVLNTPTDEVSSEVQWNLVVT